MKKEKSEYPTLQEQEDALPCIIVEETPLPETAA